MFRKRAGRVPSATLWPCVLQQKMVIPLAVNPSWRPVLLLLFYSATAATMAKKERMEREPGEGDRQGHGSRIISLLWPNVWDKQIVHHVPMLISHVRMGITNDPKACIFYHTAFQLTGRVEQMDKQYTVLLTDCRRCQTFLDSPHEEKRDR
jgi:hypothetical protein